MNKARKLTFPNAGVEQGCRVWRNSETGVEIVKGKNFAEVGLYYVCVPKVGPDVRRVVAHRGTLAAARALAASYAETWREVIAEHYDQACEQEARASMNPAHQRPTHYRNPESGYQSCGEAHSTDGLTNAPGEVTCAACRDRHSSACWERATDGMSRVPAFAG